MENYYNVFGVDFIFSLDDSDDSYHIYVQIK